MRLILIFGLLLIARPCVAQNVKLTEAEQEQMNKWLDPAGRAYLKYYLLNETPPRCFINPGKPGEVGIFMPRYSPNEQKPTIKEWKLKVNKIIDNQNAIVCDDWWLEGIDTSEWTEGLVVDWKEGFGVEQTGPDGEGVSGMLAVMVVMGEPVEYEIDGEARVYSKFIRIDTETPHTLMSDMAKNRGYDFFLRTRKWSWNQFPLIAREVSRDHGTVTLTTIKGEIVELPIVEFENEYKKQK